MSHIVHVLCRKGSVDACDGLTIPDRHLQCGGHASVSRLHIGHALVQSPQYAFCNRQNLRSVTRPLKIAVVHQIFLPSGYGEHFKLLETPKLQQHFVHVESKGIPFYRVFLAPTGNNPDRDCCKQQYMDNLFHCLLVNYIQPGGFLGGKFLHLYRDISAHEIRSQICTQHEVVYALPWP